jgi:sigma-B regulation protein RsbU (phosphoserine phosphatase)
MVGAAAKAVAPRAIWALASTLLYWQPLGGARLEDQVLATLRDQVGGIILGAIFLFIGLAACGMAAIRRRGGVRILVWFGIFSALYGGRILTQMPAAFSVLPRSTWASRPYVTAIISYLINIPALLFWLELSLGRLRRFVRIMTLAVSLVGIGGVCSAFITPSPFSFMPYNRLMVICFLLAVAVVSAVPSLAKRWMVISGRILALGTLVLAAVALYDNAQDFLHLPSFAWSEPFAFAVFILSLGYVAAEKIFADERRLLSIENELAIARHIQNSILPSSVPELKNLRITAAYHPMTAVAGDFYEFIPIDQNRVGLLVADVSGHGVPAALIASMIKVAMQSVVSRADDPAELVRGLNRSLAGPLRGQFVTAAYLWLDTEIHKASYSAAGHPPLLRWREGKLERIESNGPPFGFAPDSDYPVCDLALNPGDRFLLYTDGVIEPENASGDSFGECKLEEVVRNHQSRSPSDLSAQLLSEIRLWQPASLDQQDDITLIVVDVV